MGTERSARHISTPASRSTAIDGARTCIAVVQLDGRPSVSIRSGLLRPQLVHSSAPWCRIGLLATTALLLGGDTVELEVSVGPGAQLDLFDVAGTVAFDGRGLAAGWSAKVRVAAGAVLRWSGQPLVVAAGADVSRSVELLLEEGAVALLRDTVVLGRTGEVGGRLRSATSIHLADRLLCREEQDLSATLRTLPGMLGDLRVLDTVTAVMGSRRAAEGSREPVRAAAAPATSPPLGSALLADDSGSGDSLARFALVGGVGTVTRYLGHELDRSPLHQHWDDLHQRWDDEPEHR